MDILLAVIVVAGGIAAVGLIVIGYINNVLSFADNVKRLAGRAPKPATEEQFEEVQRTLKELQEKLAPSQGAGGIDTDELAKAAGPDTEAGLLEALELQAQGKDREAINCLYEAFTRGLAPRAEAELQVLIGNSFLRLSELEKAEGHYRQALDVSRAAGLQKQETDALGNLGLVYARRGELDRAEEHHQKALAISREINNRLCEAQDLGNLGLVYSRRGELDRAEEHHQKALAISREINNRRCEAANLGNLGLLAAQRDQQENACRLLKEAIAIYEETGAGGEGPDIVRAKLQELGCE